MEPVFVAGIFTVFDHILECKEAPSGMVEHPVQHYTDPCFVQCVADLLKIFVRSQADIYLPVIPGIVSMSV